jgi:predicted dehydrogenase
MKTAMIAAAAPFAGTAAAATTRKDSTKKKLGVALCGLGTLSTYQLAPALAKSKHCYLAGIVTGDPQKAKQWQAKYNIPDRSVYSYDTMERMADNPDIDIVYIVTPNALHRDHTLAAARAGKHVFCEKPMEITVERCQEMIDACKKADRMLGIAYRCQFEPHHKELIRIAREREFGAVKVVESAFGIQVGAPDQWRLKRDLAGGGALMDVGVYCLQATRYATGEEPILVSAVETKIDKERFAEVDETMTWTALFPSGAIAYCMASFNLALTSRINVQAEKGSFGLDPAYLYHGIKGWRSDRKPLNFPQVDQFATEIDDFALCVLNNKPTQVSGEHGMQDVRILQAIYESARTGKAVELA